MWLSETFISHPSGFFSSVRQVLLVKNRFISCGPELLILFPRLNKLGPCNIFPQISPDGFRDYSNTCYCLNLKKNVNLFKTSLLNNNVLPYYHQYKVQTDTHEQESQSQTSACMTKRQGQSQAKVRPEIGCCPGFMVSDWIYLKFILIDLLSVGCLVVLGDPGWQESLPQYSYYHCSYKTGIKYKIFYLWVMLHYSLTN